MPYISSVSTRLCKVIFSVKVSFSTREHILFLTVSNVVDNCGIRRRFLDANMRASVFMLCYNE